jgi:hypothetical protein
MFYNELEWLECQLMETYDQMTGYILVEATLDHQGHEKPLVYEANKKYFERWSDKITHVIVESLPTLEQSPNHWDRERRQRDYAMPVLWDKALPGDFIINMDIDEVPSPSLMTARPRGIYGLNLANHLYAVDWFAEWNVMGSMFPLYCLNRSWQQSPDLPGAVMGGLSWIREHRSQFPVIDKAGHHFSWTGGIGEYKAKDERTPHVEHHGDRMAPGQPEHAYYEGGGQTPVEVDDTYPRYIRERLCPPSWFRPREPIPTA